MFELVIGIIVFLFLLLGLREGIAKALGSIVIVFVSLFLATATVTFLSKTVTQLNDPKSIIAISTFLVVLSVSYLLLDLLLMFLLQRIIRIIVLGPVDVVGGAIIGAFKGVLICGIVLQLIIYYPISQATKTQIKESSFSRFAVSVYQWVYPYAKKIAPASVNQEMKNSLIEKLSDSSIEEKSEIKTEELQEELGEKLEDLKEISETQKENIKKLLKAKKLLPSIPGERIED